MKLFSWGANTYGQLSQGFKSEQCDVPREVSLDQTCVELCNVAAVTGGGGHTLMLDKNGSVYSCGWNTKGQLGMSTKTDILRLTKIELPNSVKVRKLSCGWDSSMAITDEGELLAWGSNAYGQLGLSKGECSWSAQVREVPVPAVEAVAMGLRHSAILTKSGTLLMCGDGQRGQLGLINKEGRALKQTDEPTEILSLRNVCAVACGQHHTVALTRGGACFVWGDNRHGQLGMDPDAHPRVLTPTELSFQAAAYRELAAGWSHSWLIGGSGKVANWGRNTYGQLGYCSTERQCSWKPQVFDKISGVTQLAVGSEHSIALLENGQVYSWGWNEHGNCGVGATENMYDPAEVVIDSRFKTLLIGCGAGHCFAIVDDLKASNSC